MLVSVYRHPLLCGALTQKNALCNIIINAIDVSIGMMNDIVFLLPEESITTHCVKRKSEQIIYPFFAGKASMAGIMHDIKPDTGKNESKHAAQQEADHYGQMKNQQRNINNNGRREQDH